MTALTIVRAMPFFDPAIRFGGVIAQARETSRRLAEYGHRIFVVTTDNGQPTATPRDRWVDKDGYRIYYASTQPRHRMIPYWTPMLGKPLSEVLPQADVLQLNVGLTLTNNLARRLAKRFDVPYVYNAEGALCPTRLRLKRWRKQLFTALIERRVLRQAAALQAVTAKEADDLVRMGAPRHRVHLIPNGVEPVAAVPAESSSSDDLAIRRRFEIPADVPLVLFLGRIHQIKGIDLLLDTVARAEPVRPWLLVVGPDEDGSRPALEAQARHLGIAERVRFVGTLDGAEKDAAFAIADLFALTSHTEGLPNAVLEACARGLPCLLTTPCNIPEVQEHGAGLVRSCDPTELAKALTEMLADRQELASMGVAAHQLIVEHFSLERVVNELSELYLSLYDHRA